MKQEHSRLTLEITNIKVERLGEISEENAVNEGVWNIQEKGSPRNWDIKNAFATFWNATHKKPEEKFEVNPFVWVVDFKIIKYNTSRTLLLNILHEQYKSTEFEMFQYYSTHYEFCLIIDDAL